VYRIKVALTIDLLSIKSATYCFNLKFLKKPFVNSENITTNDYSYKSGI
jgi:hypothetical protein